MRKALTMAFALLALALPVTARAGQQDREAARTAILDACMRGKKIDHRDCRCVASDLVETLGSSDAELTRADREELISILADSCKAGREAADRLGKGERPNQKDQEAVRKLVLDACLRHGEIDQRDCGCVADGVSGSFESSKDVADWKMAEIGELIGIFARSCRAGREAADRLGSQR